jgi:hypothetical protein
MSYLKKILIVFTLIGFCCMLLIEAGFCWIYSDVKKICIEAKNQFNGDCISSLILVIESKDTSYLQKNNAVWAIGQLADPKALPVLNQAREKAKCGKPCPLNKYFCRYEIDKAIKWCSKGNITSWMYFNRENWK